MWIDTWAGSETGSSLCAGLNHFQVAFLPGFVWPIFLSSLVLSPFGTSQGLPMCASISQPILMPVKSLWQVDTTPLLTFKKFSSWEDLLDLENEKYLVSCLLSGQGSTSSLDWPTIDILEFWSLDSPQRRNSICLPWGWGASTACLSYIRQRVSMKDLFEVYRMMVSFPHVVE